VFPSCALSLPLWFWFSLLLWAPPVPAPFARLVGPGACLLGFLPGFAFCPAAGFPPLFGVWRASSGFALRAGLSPLRVPPVGVSRLGLSPLWGGWSPARPRLSLSWWCAVSSPSPSPSLLCAPLGAAVAFGGSRSLPSSFSGLVASVVGAVLASGASIRVGCAVGADALVLSSAVASGPASSVSVFSFFGPGGAGAWSGSAVSAVLAASAAGASVSWWAGGGPSSGVPFRARLAVRSRACVSGSFAACFFLASPSSAGSLGAAAAAVRSGAFVAAFACGFSGPPVALFGVPAGSWVPASFFGFSCWLWVPAAGSPWSPAPAPSVRQLSLFS